jgi:ADP-heptose:LPS heptosyltransferase
MAMTDQQNGTAAGTRLLGLHSGALGDVVLFGQFITALRPPGGIISLVAGGEKARLLKSLGVVDEAIDFDALPIHEVFTESPPSACALPGLLGRCDRLVSCFAAGDANAQRRLVEMCAARRAAFLPVRPPAGDARHLLGVWADQMGGDEPPAPLWSATAAMAAEAQAVMTGAGVDPSDRPVVLHLGGGSPDKCWPAALFEAMADKLDRPTVFLAGPVEVERMAMDELSRLRARRPVIVAPSLACLAGLLAGSSAFVGADSGPAHLAAALGAPTVALFGPTDPAQFAPRGRCVRTIRRHPLSDLSADAIMAEVAKCIGL